MNNKDKLIQVGRGFCMGCADVIPGVSGGTLALILGIYQRLIKSIHLMDMVLLKGVFQGSFWNRLIKGVFGQPTAPQNDIDHRADALVFIGFLIIGIGAAIVAAAGLITYSRMNYPGQTLGFFLGLVVASLQVPFRHISRKGVAQWTMFLAIAVGTFFLLGMGQMTPTPALWYVFICGATAICAMILPGISGAFILLMMGMYDYIVVKQLKPLIYDQRWEGIGPILVFMVGMATGIIVFSRLLHYLLKRYHDVTMAGLLGLMVGSLRVLWPFKEAFPDDPHIRFESLSNILPVPAGTVFWATVVTFVAGFAIVLVLDQVGRRYVDNES